MILSDRRMMVAALLALLMAAPVALAQDAKPAEGAAPSGENRDRGGDRRFDPARMAEFMKERMGATDEEWKVIEPKLTKVMQIRGPMMFGGGFGGRGGRDGDSNAQRSPMETASRELRDLLENKDATAEQINAKLTAFREARDKSKQELAVAQKDLKEVLSARQEAYLVSRSILD